MRKSMSVTLREKCICLKLEEGSEGFKQFCEFWPILTTPIIYFITGTGDKLCDPLLGAITEQDILDAISPSTPSNQDPTPNTSMPSTSNAVSFELNCFQLTVFQ